MENKQGKWKSALLMVGLMLLSLAAGALLGLFLVGYFDRLALAGVSDEMLLLIGAGLLLGVYVALFLHILIHEAGHLVAGLMTGYRFSSFRILNFMWLLEDGKLRLRRLHVAGTGGQCLMIPPDMVDGRLPVLAYNLGGPLANLTVAAAAFALYFLLGRNSLAATLMLLLGIVGALTGLINGIPLKTNTINNDGSNALALIRDPAARKAFWIQMKVNELQARGLRLKEMPEEWFAVPENSKNSLIATLGVYACSRLMDEHRFAEADALMEQQLRENSGIVAIHRNLLTCDRVYCALVEHKDPQRAQQLRTAQQLKFQKSMKSTLSVLRTEYAWALLGEKDLAGAEKIRAIFEKHAKQYPYPSDAAAERELIALAAACDR